MELLLLPFAMIALLLAGGAYLLRRDRFSSEVAASTGLLRRSEGVSGIVDGMAVNVASRGGERRGVVHWKVEIGNLPRGLSIAEGAHPTGDPAFDAVLGLDGDRYIDPALRTRILALGRGHQLQIGRGRLDLRLSQPDVSAVQQAIEVARALKAPPPPTTDGLRDPVPGVRRAIARRVPDAVDPQDADVVLRSIAARHRGDLEAVRVLLPELDDVEEILAVAAVLPERTDQLAILQAHRSRLEGTGHTQAIGELEARIGPVDGGGLSVSHPGARGALSEPDTNDV